MKQSTFYVAETDPEAAILRDVSDGQIHTLADNPELEAGSVVEATLEAEPPMEAVWTVVEVEREYTIPVEESPEPPTQQVRDVAAEQAVGEVTTRERAGTGEVHVLTVPEENTAGAVTDIREDVATVERAARLGVERVEIRSDTGVVSVRYLP